MMPSKTLNPFEMYPKGPSAMTFSSISTANIAENTILLISTMTVNSSGWLWYSIPIDSVLMRMAKSMPCWKYLCSTRALTQRRMQLNTEQIALKNPMMPLVTLDLFFFSFFRLTPISSCCMSPQQEKSSMSMIWLGGESLWASHDTELAAGVDVVFLLQMPLVRESKKESSAIWPVGRAADRAPERARSS